MNPIGSTIGSAGTLPLVTNVTANSENASRVTREFSRRLQEHVRTASTWEDAQAAAASVLQRCAGCSFVGWFQPRGRLIGQPEVLEGLTCPEEGLSRNVRCMLTCTAEQSLQLRGTAVLDEPAEHCSYVCVPVGSNDGVLLAVVPDEDRNCVTAVELAAAKLSEWRLVQNAAAAIRESQHVAALVELVSRISACDQPKPAAQTLVNELQQYLNATHVYFGITPDERPGCRLSAVSGGSDIDAFSELSRATEAVLQEAIARGTASIWPARTSDNRHALLSHEHFARLTGAVAIVACPLRAESGQSVGALLATFSDNTIRTNEPASGSSADPDAPLTAMNFLFAGERVLATAVHAQRRRSISIPEQMRRRLRTVLSGHALRNSLVAIAAFAAVLFLPMDYKVDCGVELQPVLRRYVAAPFDAPLEQCFVDPGDVVEVDQILARMDGRELRWELAGIHADLGKATKEHNTFLSEQKFGEAAIARHEIERLQHQAALLSDRERHLDIRSPVAGVVVSGDLRDTEGVPLKTGQSLFEVAPLDKMVVELAVPEEDVRHVSAGMSLSLQLDAMPANSVNAMILRVHPAAELRDHQNVFIAEAELENSAAVLRPGMKGTAAVSTGVRALGWNLLHKPVAHIIGWLGW